MFNMGPLRVNRPGLPTQSAAFGDFLDASPKEFELNPVHVQTVTGRELEQIPQADQHRETICLFTHDRLLKVENYEVHGGIFCSTAQLEDISFDEENC